MTQPETPINYSVSQHYHHSAHASMASTALPVAVPSQSTTLGIDDLLKSHGIDSSTLSPRQMDLFQNADAEQRQRLIQTWQFYLGPISQETPMQESSLLAGELEMADCPAEAGDEQKGLAEPYMVSGYQTAAEHNSSPRKEPTTGEPYVSSTDPVYRSQECWETAQMGLQESQYGAFQERSRYDTACGISRPLWLG